ncbi:Translation initiation factor eIF-2B delta subunit [Giardia muris]|uniref:Translation initiation factor eIF2B subunit delta n=1 Tax=Giardia muris TaxID=5742 RepID=A0A4Z1SRD7_GIAMU|nr:Translation initiation factor eIF-2B delta subunit [Giardia muris]|eukprot:TNJ28426.1 Translation initiation factor eIF-2B delta subunit [Giardia muris]
MSESPERYSAIDARARFLPLVIERRLGDGFFAAFGQQQVPTTGLRFISRNPADFSSLGTDARVLVDRIASFREPSTFRAGYFLQAYEAQLTMLLAANFQDFETPSGMGGDDSELVGLRAIPGYTASGKHKYLGRMLHALLTLFAVVDTCCSTIPVALGYVAKKLCLYFDRLLAEHSMTTNTNGPCPSVLDYVLRISESSSGMTGIGLAISAFHPSQYHSLTIEEPKGGSGLQFNPSAEAKVIEVESDPSSGNDEMSLPLIATTGLCGMMAPEAMLDGVEDSRELVEKMRSYINEIYNDCVLKTINAMYETLGDCIRPTDRILFYGNSPLVLKAMLFAHRRLLAQDPSRPPFEVICIDSPDHRCSMDVMPVLVGAEIPCTYGLLTSIPVLMPKVTKIMLGCFGLSLEGSVLVRAGGNVIAAIGALYRTPLIVACETFKLTMQDYLNGFASNALRAPISFPIPSASTQLQLIRPFYDVIDASLISSFVTENGQVPPSAIQTLASRVRMNTGLRCNQ